MIDHHGYPVEPWAVRETSLDLDVLGQSESVFALANGHLGLRGNLDEGEPRALSGTYLNGFYESHPISYGERGFGFPEDGQTVVNVTDGKLIRLLVEDEPLDVHRGHLHSHERVLDLRAGILQRRLRWSSEAGRTVQVTSRRLVSFRDRSVAAICYEVEAVDEPLRVALQSNLLANQEDRGGEGDPRAGASLGAVLQSRLAVHDGLRVVLAHTTRRSGLSLAAGIEHVIDAAGAPLTRVESEPDMGRVTISAELAPGRPLRVVKLLAYHWSSQQSIEWLRDQVDASRPDSPWSVTVDWGDGSPVSTPADATATGSLGSAGHEYRSVDDAQFTVEVTVTDKDGGVGKASFTVHVDGVETQVETLAKEIQDTASIPTATKHTLALKLDQFLAGYDARDAEDKSDACDQMEPFKALLAAKTGKGITPAQASRWRADADRVADLAGC